MTCNLLSQLYFTLPACLVNNNVKVNNNLPCDKFVQVRSRAPLLGSCCICRKLPGSFLASPLFSIQEPVLFGAFYLLPRPRNSPATNLYRIRVTHGTVAGQLPCTDHSSNWMERAEISSGQGFSFSFIILGCHLHQCCFPAIGRWYVIYTNVP